MNHSIFSDDEQELINAARLVLSAGLNRLSDRVNLFPTVRQRAVDAACREARDTLAQTLVAEYGALRHEVIVLALIDAQGRLIDVVQIGDGKAAHCIVDYRKLARAVVDSGAVAILLAHNHPSGECSPSKQDVTLTEILASWLCPLECTLIDHLILTVDDWCSIKGAW
jgi:DNA repair protein RadC